MSAAKTPPKDEESFPEQPPEWAVECSFDTNNHLPDPDGLEEKWTAEGMVLLDEDGKAVIAAANPMTNRR